MATPIIEFLDELPGHGRDPLLERLRAAVRFDIIDGERTEHRLVRIDHGDIAVSTENAPADCVLRAAGRTFEAVVDGRMSPMAALLRGCLSVTGDPELLVLTQRLFAVRSAVTRNETTAAEGTS
jgi:putative sterol carrier protein